MLTALLVGFVLLPALVAGSWAVFAEPPAGVIGYSCHQQQALVLLAYDGAKDRKAWAAFGGHGEDGETIAMTAAREFREETRCVFDGPTAEQLKGRRRSVVGPFYTYVAEVPFVEVDNIESSRCGTPYERGRFVWVAADELDDAVHQNRHFHPFNQPQRSLPLWFAGRVSLQQAMDDGLLPTDHQVCQNGAQDLSTQ